jgi:DNA-binding NarL/FixJ family response regulator
VTVRHPVEGVAPLPAVVIEDHPLYRRALLDELDAAHDFTVLGCCGSIEDFEREYLTSVAGDGSGAVRPAVVLLDLHLPGLSGAEGVARLRAAGLPVLVLSAVDDPAEVLDVIAAGAAGYLTKNADGTEILTAVRTVATGGSYISPTLASYLLAAARATAGAAADRMADDPPIRAARDGAVHPDAAGLTERERTILGLVAAGETDRDIAAELHISVSTVRSHLDRIRHKTGRRRRPDLTRLAYQSGLAPDEETAPG